MALVPGDNNVLEDHGGETIPLSAFSAYDLPSVEALVRFFRATAGYPVKSTWLRAIKKGYFDTWPGLTYANVNKYCPLAIETMRGHLTQVRQGVRSTKSKQRPRQAVPEEDDQLEKESTCNDSVNELCIKVVHKSKLYTDDTGRFPV